jgi:hypothetical protein
VTIPDYGTLDVFASLLIAGALIPVFLLGNTLMSRKVGAIFVLVYLTYAGMRALGTG